MRISALIIVFLFTTSVFARCGIFQVEGFVRQGVENELVLNPQAVSRLHVKITNPELMKEFQGRVVKAELLLKGECGFDCSGELVKINGTVSPLVKIKTFTRQKASLLKEQPCLPKI